ncbi:MAG: outer membrane lipoprotein-sorting protein [Spirochaetota bacterium]
MYRSFLLVLLFFGIIFPVAATDHNSQNGDRKKPDIQQVVQAVDQLYRHDTSHTLMKMTVETPHWERTMKIESWSEGMDKILLRVLEPPKERGMGTLRIDNEMWNYLPRTNKVMKIPPSMMMSSWMGSDFKNNDLVKEFTFVDDYTFSYLSTSEAPVETGKRADSDDVLYVKCLPKSGKPIIWGHVVLVVGADDLIPRMELYYDEHGKLMRTMHFSDITQFGETRLPAVMELKPETKQGRRTTIRYLEAEFDIPLDDKIFTHRNLRTFRR